MVRLLTFKRQCLKLTIKINIKLLSWVSKEAFCIDWIKEIITENNLQILWKFKTNCLKMNGYPESSTRNIYIALYSLS